MSIKTTSANPRLVTIGPVTIPMPADTPAPIDTPVENANGEVFPVAPQAETGRPVSPRQLLKEAHATIENAICGTDDTKTGTGTATGPSKGARIAKGTRPAKGTQTRTPLAFRLTPAFVSSYRVATQMVLFFVKTPPTIQMLSHTPNASTDLLPAVDCVLAHSEAIFEIDPRIRRRIDLVQIAAQKVLLVQLRGLLKITRVAAYCLDAGTTHVEQYLDACMRWIYAKLMDALGEDLLLQEDLAPLVTLVSSPIEAGQESKKTNAKVQAEADERAAEAQAAASSTGSGTGVVNTSGTAAQGQGTPPPPAVTGATLPTVAVHVTPTSAQTSTQSRSVPASTSAARKSTARSIKKKNG